MLQTLPHSLNELAQTLDVSHDAVRKAYQRATRKPIPGTVTPEVVRIVAEHFAKSVAGRSQSTIDAAKSLITATEKAVHEASTTLRNERARNEEFRGMSEKIDELQKSQKELRAANDAYGQRLAEAVNNLRAVTTERDTLRELTEGSQATAKQVTELTAEVATLRAERSQWEEKKTAYELQAKELQAVKATVSELTATAAGAVTEAERLQGIEKQVKGAEYRANELQRQLDALQASRGFGANDLINVASVLMSVSLMITFFWQSRGGFAFAVVVSTIVAATMYQAVRNARAYITAEAKSYGYWSVVCTELGAGIVEVFVLMAWCNDGLISHITSSVTVHWVFSIGIIGGIKGLSLRALNLSILQSE